MYFLTILMLCYYPLCKEGILCFLNTVCKELILYDGAKLKRIFHTLYHYEKCRYEKCRNRNQLQRYNFFMTPANISPF